MGFEWATTHNGSGYRCGYIRVPLGHPWHGKDWDAFDAEVHGGITFAAPDKHCDKLGDDDAWWVGFDCAHCDDAPDPELPGYRDFGWPERGSVRSQDFVEQQCRSLCEQASLAAGITQ